jgi:FkbM family methyltransferase
MNIQCLAEHSVDLDLLSGGICIDAGCRGFQFSEAMRDKGLFVFACDVEDMKPPEGDGIYFYKAAITTETGIAHYVDTKDQQAKYISNAGIPVPSISLNDLYNVVKTTDVNHIDVLKLDIEGSEYRVLADPAFQPLPKQISVEFHMHCHRKLHDQYYEACMENLLKSYVPVQHELTQAHGAGWNYWNSLFVRRDLL